MSGFGRFGGQKLVLEKNNIEIWKELAIPIKKSPRS
jgi:hypothetical protein